MYVIDESEARRLLAELVAIDSVNPSLVPGGAGEQAVAEYIRNYLEGIGICSRLDQVSPGRPNVVAVLPAESPEACVFDARHGLMLNGHVDTVSTAGMNIEPLKARFEGDKVYGRGTGDMKGGVVSALLAMAAIKRSGRKLRRSVLFTGVCDEEYASIGTEDVARRYRADAAIITEPTALNLTVAHKGFAWLTVDVTGRAAHGSYYQAGVDAILQMGKVLSEVSELTRRYLRAKPHPIVGLPSIHASLISGGTELSTYPDRCVAQFERRTIPGEEPSGIGVEMEEVLGRLRKADATFDAKVTVDFTRNAYEINPGSTIVKALISSCKSILGREPQLGGSTGWMDSALLGDVGIPAVIFGPEGSGAHSAVEYVTMSSILNTAAVLADVIENLCY